MIRTDRTQDRAKVSLLSGRYASLILRRSREGRECGRERPGPSENQATVTPIQEMSVFPYFLFIIIIIFFFIFFLFFFFFVVIHPPVPRAAQTSGFRSIKKLRNWSPAMVERKVLFSTEY